MKKLTTILNAEFMEKFYLFDEKKGMYHLIEKVGRLPAFWYLVDDSAIYVEGPEHGELFPVTYEINTLEKLIQWYDLMFSYRPEFLSV